MLIIQKESKISELLGDTTPCAIHDVVMIFHFLNFLVFFSRNFMKINLKQLSNVVHFSLQKKFKVKFQLFVHRYKN